MTSTLNLNSCASPKNTLQAASGYLTHDLSHLPHSNLNHLHVHSFPSFRHTKPPHSGTKFWNRLTPFYSMSFMEKFRASRLNYWFQRLLRVFQFLSALISLGLFSARLAKIIRLTHLASKSNGAVEGILVAAVLYTLTVMLLTFLLKHGAPKPVRWLLILMDLLFLGAFIAVSYLTRPNGGSSGPCKKSRFERVIPTGEDCNLPWGTFILAIFST